MVLEYAEGARLYVPLTRLDLVQKYRSSEGVKPVLNRLGTQQWQKTKARVKKAMKDMAEELLKLYAVRKAAEGHGFAPTPNGNASSKAASSSTKPKIKLMPSLT